MQSLPRVLHTQCVGLLQWSVPSQAASADIAAFETCKCLTQIMMRMFMMWRYIGPRANESQVRFAFCAAVHRLQALSNLLVAVHRQVTLEVLQMVPGAFSVPCTMKDLEQLSEILPHTRTA